VEIHHRHQNEEELKGFAKHSKKFVWAFTVLMPLFLTQVLHNMRKAACARMPDFICYG